jgi:hypothetical protein
MISPGEEKIPTSPRLGRLPLGRPSSPKPPQSPVCNVSFQQTTFLSSQPRARSYLRPFLYFVMGAIAFSALSNRPSFPDRHSRKAVVTNDFGRSLILIGSHHKSGTGFVFSVVTQLIGQLDLKKSALLFGIFGPSRNVTDIATFYSNENDTDLPDEDWINTASNNPLSSLLVRGSKRSRFIHLVRDPVEMVVSAYLYHLQEPEEEMWWLTSPGLVDLSPRVRSALSASNCPHSNDLGWKWTWLEVLRCLPLSEGIVAEGWKMIEQDIEPMARICREVDCVHPETSFKLDIDDVGRNFSSSVSGLLAFVGVKRDSRRSLLASLRNAQKTAVSTSATHITTGKYDKDKLRKLLSDDAVIRARLEQLRSDVYCTIPRW